MLHNYRSSEGYRIYRHEFNSIRSVCGFHPSGWVRYSHELATIAPRTWRQSATGRNFPQSAIGRIRAAVAAAVGSHVDHATCGAIARQILKSARFTRIDLDHPETHLAFSPPGIKSHDMRGRRSLAFGRYLRRKCSDFLRDRLAMSDTAVCRASAAFATAGSTGGLADLLEIARGKDAYAIYNDNEHGISSCMSGKIKPSWQDDPESNRKAKYIRHYLEANPDKIGVINARWNETLILRAQLVTNDDGSHWLSRIYWQPTSGSPIADVSRESELTPILESWCRTQGLRLVATPDATLNHDLGEDMPYLDRCSAIDRVNSSKIRLHPDGDWDCDNTDGKDPTDGSSCRCCACSERIDEDDARHTDSGDGPYCEDCYGERFAWDEIDECDISADDCVNAYRTGRSWRTETVRTHQDNCVRSCISRGYWVSGDNGIVELHDGDYVEVDETEYVEIMSAYYLTSDCVCDHAGEYQVKDDCVKLVNGEWCHEDDGDLVKLHDGRYCLTGDAVETIDGEFALSDDCIEIVDDYGNIVYRIATDADVLQVA